MPFGFFEFWKGAKREKKAPASEIPLLSSLTPTELRLIENRIRRVEFKKGDVVYKSAGKPEAFYIILSGRFRVISPSGQTLSILSQGEYFGESSILLNREHSATVEAKNDGLVLKIDKNDFLTLLKEIPSLSLHLSRTLGHRLAAGAKGSEASEAEIIAVFDYADDFEKKIFSWNLVAMLGTDSKKKPILVGFEDKQNNRFSDKSTDVLQLSKMDPDHLDQVDRLIREEKGSFFFLRISDGIDGEELEKRLSALLNYLNDRFDFVLLDLPTELDELSVKALKQSDVVFYLVPEESRDAPKTASFIKEFQGSYGFTPDEIRLIIRGRLGSKKNQARPYRLNNVSSVHPFAILPYEASLYARERSDQLPFVLTNAESAYSRAIRFLSRELTGNLVGLALGSGAAFGFAHLGVFKVLEDEKIPIDIIAGSSIGALLGSMWASGIDAKTLIRIARGLDRKSVFFKLVGFLDFSVPHRGFFKGLQVNRFLRKFMRGVTFRKLNIPVKVVAADLFTSEEVIFDEGDVVDAIRASISIPGIFRPVRKKDDYFIDGGVVDPLPVKVLSRYGVKKIIAVNVLPSPEDHIHRRELHETRQREAEFTKERRSLSSRLWRAMGRKLQAHFRDNVFNVLMNTIQFLEYGIVESSSTDADIFLHPVVPNSHWAEFYSIDKFVKCGEEKTAEQVDAIKKLVEEEL